jgi:hypothetical protein
MNFTDLELIHAQELLLSPERAGLRQCKSSINSTDMSKRHQLSPELADAHGDDITSLPVQMSPGA